MRGRTAWILGGIAAALPVVGLLVLNFNGDSKPVEIPLLPQSPTGPSHPRLQVLDEPGRWESESSASNASVTNSNTCHLDTRWGLNGHCLFLEEKVFKQQIFRLFENVLAFLCVIFMFEYIWV